MQIGARSREVQPSRMPRERGRRTASLALGVHERIDVGLVKLRAQRRCICCCDGAGRARHLQTQATIEKVGSAEGFRGGRYGIVVFAFPPGVLTKVGRRCKGDGGGGRVGEAPILAGSLGRRARSSRL